MIWWHKISVSLKVTFNHWNISYDGFIKCWNDQNQDFDDLFFNLCIYSQITPILSIIIDVIHPIKTR